MAVMTICKILSMLLVLVCLTDLQSVAAEDSCGLENQWCNQRPCCHANTSCEYYNFGLYVCRLQQAACAQLGEDCTSPNLCCNPRHICAPSGNARTCRDAWSRPVRP